MISLRSDSVNPSLFSSRMAGRSGFPIMSPFDPCLPCSLIGAFHESQTALSSLYFILDFCELGNFLRGALLPVDLLQGEGDFEVRGLLCRDFGDRTDFLPAGPHVRFTEHVGLDDRSQDERGGRYRQYGPDYRSHHAEAEEVAAGNGIFLQLRHASPLLEPPGLTCRTRSAVDSVAPYSQADYIPCKAPWNWTS